MKFKKYAVAIHATNDNSTSTTHTVFLTIEEAVDSNHAFGLAFSKITDTKWQMGAYKAVLINDTNN